MANRTNRTPFGLALAIQREAIRQGQRTVEQGMDAQQSMTEAFVHNAIGMGRAANRNATEATRQGMVTFAGMVDAMNPVGANTRPSVEQGFDSVTDAQENAWRIFEETTEDGLAAYAQLAESGTEVLSESMGVTLAAHEEAGRRSSDAAVEYERQTREKRAASGAGQRESGQREPTPPTSSEVEAVEIESDEAGESVTEPGEPATKAGEPMDDVGEPAMEAGEPASGPLLEDLSGVGAAYADRLRAAGVESVQQLLDEDVDSLSTETEISNERLSNWQRQARHLLDEE